MYSSAASKNRSSSVANSATAGAAAPSAAASGSAESAGAGSGRAGGQGSLPFRPGSLPSEGMGSLGTPELARNHSRTTTSSNSLPVNQLKALLKLKTISTTSGREQFRGAAGDSSPRNVVP